MTCGIWSQILPLTGKKMQRNDVSASQEAAQIHDWLLEHDITHLSLGFGASLGGVVLSELLKFPDLVFDRLFFEGTSFWTGGFFCLSDGTCTQESVSCQAPQSHCRPRVIRAKDGTTLRKSCSKTYVRAFYYDERSKHPEHHSRLQQR